MKNDNDDKAQLVAAYRDMYSAMLARRTDQLDALLDDQYSLTHITGYRQPKQEWLSAIASGEMLYHAAREDSVSVEVHGDTAVLVGRSKVTATIYGGRGTWNLQLTTNYARKDGSWIAKKTIATTY
jgi:ketosteroid isomerase-like protein